VFIFLTTEGAEGTEEKHEKLQRQAQSEIPNEATNACAYLCERRSALMQRRPTETCDRDAQLCVHSRIKGITTTDKEKKP
jgi:hypothetical protein